MGLFGRKKQGPNIIFDSAKQEPAVRKSICTGEMTGGLVDRDTGRFHELELLRTQEELEGFCRRVGVNSSEIKIIY